MASIERRGVAWRARVRIKGKIATRTFDTEAEASEWAADTEKRIKAGQSPIEAKATPPGQMTVADLFDRYAREISPDKQGGRWEVIRLRALGEGLAGPASAIDGPKLAEWRDKRLQSVKAATVNRELNLISAVYTRAIKEWRLPVAANPVAGVQRPKDSGERTRRVSDAERDAICRALGWIEGTPPVDLRQWVALAFLLCLETAIRQGEALGLCRANVHLDKRYVHLPRTKNGSKRDVPLSLRAVDLLRIAMSATDGERVIPLESGTCGAYFRQAVQDAEIDNLHFHDSRHEAITRLAKKFPNHMDLSKITGHRDLKKLLGYYHPDATELAGRLD